MDDADDPVLAEVGASMPRRYLAAAVLGSLGVVLIWLGFGAGSGLSAAIVMIAVGGLVLWLTLRLWVATAVRVLYRRSGLYTEAGILLAPREGMLRVDRGAFAFKPSNGFVLILDRKMGRGWAPGLWWRGGRRVGVGGVVAAGACKFMAEQIALDLARD